MLCHGLGSQKERKRKDLKNCAGPYVPIWLRSYLLWSAANTHCHV